MRDKGSFLLETWSLHPAICSFTSELFYEGRLVSLDGLERQIIQAPQPFSGAGLWFVPVMHEGNRTYSTEEVERVAIIWNSSRGPDRPGPTATVVSRSLAR